MTKSGGWVGQRATWIVDGPLPQLIFIYRAMTLGPGNGQNASSTMVTHVYISDFRNPSHTHGSTSAPPRTLYRSCYYFFMLGLKLIHVIKGPRASCWLTVYKHYVLTVKINQLVAIDATVWIGSSQAWILHPTWNNKCICTTETMQI